MKEMKACENFSRTLRKAVALCALLLTMTLLSAGAHAQQAAAGALSATSSSPMSGAADERYRIGTGDVLEVRVFNRPQLSREAVRVDGLGKIRMPMIEGEIQAGCRTESELAKEIATAYLKYQRNPHIDVFIKEYNSKPVAVIGAVAKPGQFQLQRPVRLLELISFAGGPLERAGQHLLVVHDPGAPSCAGGLDENAANLSAYDLNDTIKGDTSSNPYVRPGDVITIQEAEQVFVVGNVYRPASIALKEPVTVSRAIAMAGGALPDSKSDKVRIVRQVKGSTTKTEMIVDLKAIEKRQAEDVVLLPNDIVDVPTSTGKRVLRNLVNAIAPAASQFPLRIIP